MGRIIEGTWDCPHCGTKKILARYKNCTNCGAPQGKDTNYEMPDKITYVSKEEAAKISRNPDWLCSFCEQLNKDTDNTCKGCGASKEDSEKNYFKMKEEREAKEREIEEREKELFEESTSDVDIDSSKDFKETIKSFFKNINLIALGKVLGVSLLSILVISGLIYLFIPKNDTLNVSELQWSRSISIEKEKTVDESGWSIPSGGRLQYTREEIHHYEQVLDHYETIVEEKSREVLDHYETVTEQKSRQVVSGYEEVVTGYRDLGNGYFEEITSSRPVYSTEYYTESSQQPVYRTEYYTETRQEPVYRDEPVYKTKYYYEIDKWFYERSIDTSGINNEPYWGEVILGNKEREGSRSESYSIKAFNSKEEEKTYTMDYNTWKNINVSDTLNVKVYFGGNIEILDENGEVIQFE